MEMFRGKKRKLFTNSIFPFHKIESIFTYRDLYYSCKLNCKLATVSYYEQLNKQKVIQLLDGKILYKQIYDIRT